MRVPGRQPGRGCGKVDREDPVAGAGIVDYLTWIHRINRIPTPDGYEMIHSIFDFGYLFSQLYIGEFAMKKFSSIIYDRHTSENTSLLENLPAIGNIFNKDHTRSAKYE